MAETSSQGRGIVPPPVLLTLDTKLEAEPEVLDALLSAHAEQPLDPTLWTRLHEAATRDGRVAELAFAYEAAAEDRRLRTMAPSAVAEFMFHASVFFDRVFGDDDGAIAFLRRALTAQPTFAPAFDALASQLAKRDKPKLAELFVEAAHHRPRAEQGDLLRQAAAIYDELPGETEKALDLYAQAVRLDPADTTARAALAAAYKRAGRHKDEARVLEQGLVALEGGNAYDSRVLAAARPVGLDSPYTRPTPALGIGAVTEWSRTARERLLVLYADELKEVERTMPHVEALIARFPAHEKANEVAKKLLEVRGMTARAADALRGASEVAQDWPEVGRYLGLELEHARGPRRLAILKRLGMLKLDELKDREGAFEVIEQALGLDPSDAELRQRYVALAADFGREGDAARTLGRIATTAKEPAVRSRLQADVADLLARTGDHRRARVVYQGVLATPEASDDAVLDSARALARIHEAAGELRPLADVLERLSELEPDAAGVQRASEKLAEIAGGQLHDPARAAIAWRRLLGTEVRGRALNELERIYKSLKNAPELAFVLGERSKDARDPEEARAMLMQAAEALSQIPNEETRATDTWLEVAARFGPARDVHAAVMPRLEEEGRFAELARMLEVDAELAPESERGALLARAGHVRLQRLSDVPGAIELFRRALAADAGERSSRIALEKLLASGDHRVHAAGALEPIYRAEEQIAGLLRVLEVKAELEGVPAARIEALDEAARVAADSHAYRDQAIDFAGRALTEAALHDLPLESWIERVVALADKGDARRRADIFSNVLGEAAITTAAGLLLASHAGQALCELGDNERALAIYRRALAFDPSSATILARLDAILEMQGNAEERVSLYRAALARDPNAAAKKRILLSIAALERHGLKQHDAAIATYKDVIALDPEDKDAHAALVQLYTEAGRSGDLLALYDEHAARLPPNRAADVHLRAARVAADHKDFARAARHAGAVLEHDELDSEDLDAIEKVAETAGDAALLMRVLEKRTVTSADPKGRVLALERLGTAQKEQSGDEATAKETWRRAARIAEDAGDKDTARRLYERVRRLAPDDRDATRKLALLLEAQERWTALPELYAVLDKGAETKEERAEVLGKLGQILADRIGDTTAALDVCARAFDLVPDSPSALLAFERLAVAGGGAARFAQAVDRWLKEGHLAAVHQGEMRLAKARVFSRDPAFRDEAAATFRALMEDASVDSAVRAAAEGSFERFIDAAEPSEARNADRRWLLEWRSRSSDPDSKLPALLAWAAAEEAIFGDEPRALSIYREVLAIDPEHIDAQAALARLTLATGDVEGAIEAILAARDRADGAARRALELRMVALLLDRGERIEIAIEALEGLLGADPNDAEAIELAARAVKHPSLRERAITLLVSSSERAPEEERGKILALLVDAAGKAGVPAERRRTWFEGLILAQRGRGRAEAALSTTLRALEEWPRAIELWDQAEELSRELQSPAGVADLYARFLSSVDDPEVGEVLGERAVAFHEEWFDDPTRVIGLLDRILTISPKATWAFDRIKLILDAREDWKTLFSLYDRVIPAADGGAKVVLLEEAAQTAKDFANDADRAAGYLEQLLTLRPNDARLVGSLERIYERYGRHKELVVLLGRELVRMNDAQKEATRVRMITLYVDELKDAEAAMGVVEDLLVRKNEVLPSLSALGPKDGALRIRVRGMVERILAEAPPVPATIRESLPPGRPSEPAPSDRELPGKGSAGSIAPPSRRGRRAHVRQRAAELLRAEYAALGDDSALAKSLSALLEFVREPTERVRRHEELAALFTKLGNDDAALEHYVALVGIEPDVTEHREALEKVAAKTGRFDRLGDVLADAAEANEHEPFAPLLYSLAAATFQEKLSRDGRAIELYGRVLASPVAEKATKRLAARKLDPLLERVERRPERLLVLERLAELEDEPAARLRALGAAATLAMDVGEDSRAIQAWRSRLAMQPTDEAAIDGLVTLYDRADDPRTMADVLATRASLPGRELAARRADRVRIAGLWRERIGDRERAIQEWREIEREFGEDEASTVTLAALLDEAGRYRELADLLERASGAATGARKVAVLARLGDVERERLGDEEAAAASYAKALAIDPRDQRARAGIRALLDSKGARKLAVATLLRAYADADDWRLILELTPLRLEAAEDDAAKVAVLEDAAKLEESRAGDRAAARRSWRMAWVIDPESTRAEDELARLSELDDGHQELADATRATIATLAARNPAPLRALTRLRVHLGEITERRLGDPSAALATYQDAFRDAPDDLVAAVAIVRAAAASGNWAAAARAVVERASVLGELGRELSSTVELVAGSRAAWDAVTQALEAEVRARPTLSPRIVRDVEETVAMWHRDRRGDPDAAEAAFQRALAQDPKSAVLLGELAHLQRRAKGRPLVESLLRLSEATGGDPTLLREAAEIALGPMADRALAKSVLERLLTLAAARWGAGDRANESPKPDTFVRFATDALIAIAESEEDHARTVELLLSDADRPWDRDVRRAERHRAAELLVGKLGDAGRAIELTRALYDEDSRDSAAAARLASLYTAEGRTEELLSLRRHQASGEPDVEKRAELRLEVSRLETTLGNLEAAFAALRANLADDPRHKATALAMAALLDESGRRAELPSFLADQASLAEGDGQKDEAVLFWERAAETADSLGEDDEAARYHGRVVALAPRARSYDALARIAAGRGDHVEVAAHLVDLRNLVPPTERATVTLRLADAYEKGGRLDRAREELESALLVDESADAVRSRLADLARARGDHQTLAILLESGADHAGDVKQKVSRLSESASLYRGPCKNPEKAVSLFERAAALDPGDRAVKLALADTLGAAGRTNDARVLLRGIVDAYGGRRPKERAAVHVHLARLDLATGDRTGALGELEAAARIDPTNPEILREQAELAKADGQFERAERAFRALLAIVRRSDASSAPPTLSRSDVLLELADIAAKNDQKERASEILESALTQAAEDDGEALRLEAALRKRDEYPTLVRALEMRLRRNPAPATTAAILAELALVLEERLGRPDEAFSTALRAVRTSPGQAKVHETAHRLAQKLGRIGEYATALDEEEARAKAAENLELATRLGLEIAKVREEDLGDVEGAAAAYELLADATDDATREASLRALDRIYAELDRPRDRERTVERLVTSLARGAARTPPSTLAALYLRLAASRIESDDDEDKVLAPIEKALEVLPGNREGLDVLRRLLAKYPGHEPSLSVYERAARATSDPRALLDVLRLRAERGTAPVKSLREAVGLARSIGESALAEALLRRYLELAKSDAGEVTHRSWALLALADLVEARGDKLPALRFRLEAAAGGAAAEGRRIRLEVARNAGALQGGEGLAHDVYKELLAEDPTDRSVWEPLLEILRKRKDFAAVAALIGRIAHAMPEATRIAFRLERARLLLAADPLSEEAACDLRAVLDESPDHAEAATLLMVYLEKRGDSAGVAGILEKRLERARAKGDTEDVVRILADLGDRAMVAGDRPRAAVFYRDALAAHPDDEALLKKTVEALGPEGDLAERAELMERLLKKVRGAPAETLALELAALRDETWDADGAERALAAGLRAHPTSAPLRARLLTLYRDGGETTKLADALVLVATPMTGGAEKSSLLREAARLYRDELKLPERAAELFREAHVAAPDPLLLREVIGALVDAGNLQAATAELTAAAAHLPDSDPARAALLAQRAELRARLGDLGGALYDLERAYTLQPNNYLDLLVAQLDALREEARSSSDLAKEGALTLRVAALLSQAGRHPEARGRLGILLERDTQHRPGLRALAELEEAAADYKAAVETYARLLRLDDGKELVETAMKLALAAEKGGILGEAREALERAHLSDPTNVAVREKLRELFEHVSAWAELAELYAADARNANAPSERFAALVRSATIILDHELEPDQALVALEEAHRLQPDDLECTALLADAHLAIGLEADAETLLQAALGAYKGRRARELGPIHYRMAKVARAREDRDAELAWLSSALDMDGQDGVAASELAQVALEEGQLELATKALRVITMLKVPAPLPRAVAYQRLGEVAHLQGDTKRALLLLKRAIDDDPQLESARTLLSSLQS